jgi:hypothetical protein
MTRPFPTAGALAVSALLSLGVGAANAQTIEDGVMMPKRALCTGFLYMHEDWDQYWEGTLKRSSGNIGTITTQSVTWAGNYGVTDRLNVIAMVPYVWTSASQGTLSGQSGFQDLTVAAKYNLLETPFTKAGSLRTIVVASAGTPLSDYVPDLYPLTIGMASSTVSGRLTLMFQAKQGWFVTATGAYTWRGKVTLDRPSYFTDGELYLTDEVVMPDAVDFAFSAGYNKGGLYVPISFYQRITQGGGDIRRQDMPFASNRMNVSRLDAVVMYYLPKSRKLSVRLAGNYVLDGRNVGQGTTLSAGLLYTFNF